MRRRAPLAPALLFALAPLLQGCSESEIPVEPEGEPRFTNLVIDRLEVEPSPGANVDAGAEIDVDLTATYQLSNGWEDEDLVSFLIINSFANDVFVQNEVTVSQDVSGDRGTINFSGSFTVPDCGSIDELLIYIDLSLASDPDVVADSDIYFVDVDNAGSTAC